MEDWVFGAWGFGGFRVLGFWGVCGVFGFLGLWVLRVWALEEPSALELRMLAVFGAEATDLKHQRVKSRPVFLFFRV